QQQGSYTARSHSQSSSMTSWSSRKAQSLPGHRAWCHPELLRDILEQQQGSVTAKSHIQSTSMTSRSSRKAQSQPGHTAWCKISQNYKITGLEETLKITEPNPAPTAQLNPGPQCHSQALLNTPRDGDSTTSLGRTFQNFITLS
ncbi:unnamed protein product, partial [Coccothraustes coccothraustes]